MYCRLPAKNALRVRAYILSGYQSSQMLHLSSVSVVIDCGAPPSPDNASPASTVTATIFGVDVTYVCDVGYLPEGQATITCEESGSWSGDGPQCNGLYTTLPYYIHVYEIVSLVLHII